MTTRASAWEAQQHLCEPYLEVVRGVLTFKL